MSKDVTYKIKFKLLNVGDIFYIWGDYYLNYDRPVWCKCKKTGLGRAEEIDGVNFYFSENDEVSVEI